MGNACIQRPKVKAEESNIAKAEGARKRSNGTGTSNGVNYSCSLLTDNRSGRYECRIHRDFLDANVEEFQSGLFTVAGRKWRLRVKNRQGEICLFLALVGSGEPVDVHYKFKLINPSDSTKSVTRGWRKTLRPGGTWGHCDVISAADVGDPEAGYLLENCLIVVLNIGIIPPEYQNLVFCTAGSYTATWKLRRLREIGFSDIISGDIRMADSTWNLKLKRTTSITGDDRWGIFLVCSSHSTAKIVFSVTLVNHLDETQCVTKELAHKFTPGASSRGWPSFVDMTDLSDPVLGFLDDECITFAARISFKNRKENSIAEEDSPRRSASPVAAQMSKSHDGEEEGHLSYKQTDIWFPSQKTIAQTRLP